jgi:hypothetical protein
MSHLMVCISFSAMIFKDDDDWFRIQYTQMMVLTSIFYVIDEFWIMDSFIQDDYILYMMMDFIIWIWIGQFDLQRIFAETIHRMEFMTDSRFLMDIG